MGCPKTDTTEATLHRVCADTLGWICSPHFGEFSCNPKDRVMRPPHTHTHPSNPGPVELTAQISQGPLGKLS